MSTGEGAPEPEGLIIRDKRRLDPETGAARLVEEVEDELDFESVRAELTSDLQRLSAEYANYRKRVERDRIQVLELATGSFLESLLPLLDSVELARQHGDLEGGFKGVGEALEQIAERQGLERFTEPGDPFDPAIHHALLQAPESPDATVATVAEVLQPGWRLRSGRVLRPAGVAVSEPAGPAEMPDAPE